jgi:hypothetical protein
MSSRSTLAISVCALSILGFSACKTVYSDTFSYRKNSFKAPVAKEPEIKATTIPILPETGGAGGLMPGGVPGAPMPDGAAPGAIPGLPGAPAPEGVPGVPATPPPAPGAPAVPGL